MSKSDKPEADGKPQADQDEGIIEAEIVNEQPQATTKATISIAEKPKSKITLSRIGWGIALLAIAFIGGIFMEPLAEQGLKRLGLMKEAPEENLPAQIDLTPINTAQEQQKERITSLEAAFTIQGETVAALKLDNDNLKRDITTLTTGLDTSGAAQLSSTALASIEERMNTIEAELLSVKSNSVASSTDASTVTRLEGELRLARAETAQLLERLTAFEASFELAQSNSLDDSPEGRAAVVLHRLYRNATAGNDFSADIAALKPNLNALPLLAMQPVSQALNILEANQGGIATHNEIAKSFNSLIPELLKAEVAEENTGWLANFFTVRRTDAKAEGIEASIRDIEGHLANRDLATATDVANTLPENVKSVLEAWLSSASARGETLAALTRLLNTLSGNTS